MKRKAPTQKNTLLKAPEANAATKAFKRVFFSPTQEEIQIIFFPTLRFFNYLFFQRTVQTRTDTAYNVNRLEQSVCEYGHDSFGQTAAHAGNNKINAIKKRRGV